MKQKMFLGLIIAFVVGLLLSSKIPSIIHATGGEALTSGWTTRITYGETLYPNEGTTFIDTTTWDPNGYCMIPYPPVYYILWGLIDRISGPSGSTGPSISFVATLLTGGLLYLLVTRLTRRKLLGLVGSILFLTSVTVTDWSIAPKSDMLALMFTILGLYLAVRNNVLWTVLIFALAVFTKQSYIIAPLAVICYLLLKDRKKALVFTCTMGVFLLVPFILINYGTHGEFYRHIISFPIQSGGSGIVDWSSTLSRLGILFGLNIIALSLGLGGLIFNLIKKKIGLIEIWFCLTTVLMICTIGKPGASSNYGLESIAAACVIGSIFVGILLEKGLRRFDAIQVS
jgi:4-amino-4-deoxy-L-arabinose transferase-like glycosyltransferase